MISLEEKISNMPKNNEQIKDEYSYYTDLQHLLATLKALDSIGGKYFKKIEKTDINVGNSILVIHACEELISAIKEILEYDNEFVNEHFRNTLTDTYKLLNKQLKETYKANELSYYLTRDLYTVFNTVTELVDLYTIMDTELFEANLNIVKNKE